MIPIVDVLNKIKWDFNENEKNYIIVYYDRITDGNHELRFSELEEINNLFILVNKVNEEINIPVHSIRAVKKGSKIIWKR